MKLENRCFIRCSHSIEEIENWFAEKFGKVGIEVQGISSGRHNPEPGDIKEIKSVSIAVNRHTYSMLVWALVYIEQSGDYKYPECR